MELFEQTQREYRFGVGTVRDVARQLGVHRRMLRQALSAVLPDRKVPVRANPRLGPVIELSTRFYGWTSTRRESSGTQHTVSGIGFGRSGPSSGWLNRPCVTGGRSVTRRRQRAAEGRS